MTGRRQVPISELMPDVTITLAPGDMVTTAICIALVVPLEGDDRRPSLALAHTPGTHWITQRGMLSAALDIDRGMAGYVDIEEDE